MIALKGRSLVGSTGAWSGGNAKVESVRSVGVCLWGFSSWDEHRGVRRAYKENKL